jgi:hypothetical protein
MALSNENETESLSETSMGVAIENARRIKTSRGPLSNRAMDIRKRLQTGVGAVGSEE